MGTPTVRAWVAFALLFALMVVDFADRQVVVSMFPHLKAEWRLSDAQLGALVSIVSLVVAIGAVPLSLVADRWSRVRSIFVMALLWSGATIACAFAGSYAELMVARGIVGVGEAAYGAAGAALLAALFPPRMRSSVLGAFLAAGVLGSLLGVVLGGAIAERYGWRAGFGAVGVPGVLLAVLFVMVVRDYRTPPLAATAARPARAARDVVEALFRPRCMLATCVGAGLQLVVVSTVYAWLPSYLNREWGLAPDVAAARAGVVVLAGGIGTVVWSILADRLGVRHPRARLHVPLGVAIASAVLTSVAFGAMTPGPAQFAMIVAAAATMTGTLGPVAAVVVDVAHPGLRATAAAVLALAGNLIGLSTGPLLAGMLSDAYGLGVALTIIPAFGLAAAAMFAFAARRYEGDLAMAPPEPEPVDDVPRVHAA